MHTNIIFISILNFLCSSLVKCNDVLGCGGYVRSKVDINYSQVRIKLLTLQGNLKFETECAPNNGYYFIQLYDKGDYLLRVSPPSGWTFEPEEVTLKVDGETDPCSLSQDIDFHFKGFAVVGKVVSVESETGPVGVTVSLKQGEKEILRTTTTDDGDYVFTPLASGTYTVVASHPTWKLINDKVTVTVTDQNGDAGSTIVVGGYYLSGNIEVNGNLAGKVNFVLHSLKKNTHGIGCVSSKPKGYESRIKEPILCHTTSDSKGTFSFSNVSPGKYTIVPYFSSSAMKYEVVPAYIVVDINHDDLQLSESFKVKGCSMRGIVKMGEHSNGISGAKIVLDGEFATETDEKGHFVYEYVKFGKHVFKVTADNVEFKDFETLLSIDNPVIAPIVPIRYKVCFSVSVDSATGADMPWSINIVGSNSKHQVKTDSTGFGCSFLAPGEYNAAIPLTPQDEDAGIRFGPKEHVFKVEEEPIKTLAFSQFLGEIHGIIQCLESCRMLTVSLRSARGSSGTPRTTTSNQGKFVFTEVVPGDYLVSVDKEEWCWSDQTLPVTVDAKNVSAKFSQTGYRLTLNASHRTSLNYVTNTRHSGKLNVAKGTSRECVSSPGKYVFTPSSCHKFGNSPLTWDTSSPQLLSLIASHHQVTGTLRSDEPGPFTITVKSGLGQETTLGPLEPSPNDKNIYIFDHWLEEGESVTFIPSSSSNLFQYSPSSYDLKMKNDCMFSVIEFKAERALFLKGYVKPPLKGVTIKVIGVGDDQAFTTNAEGFFIAGPLDKLKDYTVTAEKVGYILKPAAQKVDMGAANQFSEIIKMSFEAYKLAEINVKVMDEEGNPLGGVLVSTSGGKNYRQNSLTENDGTIVFQSLMPSDYFIRPMMKEYTFDPPSKMVEVEGGATVNVTISGVRMAYSIFGQTVSLSGDPEGDVVVEAIGVGDPCMDLQEEAVADVQGNFRIRGLVPKCDYSIRLKKGEGINQHVDRSLQAERIIRIETSDHVGMRVVVIRHFLQMDVAIIVHTDHQYLPSLTAELYRDDFPDTPVHVVTLGQHPFFMLPPMMADKQTYSLQLVSSLPHSQYHYILPVAVFKANSSFIKLTMSFKPTLKSVEAEISHGTVFGLILFIVIVTVGFNYNKIQPLLINLREMVANVKYNKSVAPTSVTDSFYIESANVRKRVKSRKT